MGMMVERAVGAMRGGCRGGGGWDGVRVRRSGRGLGLGDRLGEGRVVFVGFAGI